MPFVLNLSRVRIINILCLSYRLRIYREKSYLTHRAKLKLSFCFCSYDIRGLITILL